MSFFPIIKVTIPGLRDFLGRFAKWEDSLATLRQEGTRHYLPTAIKVLRKNAPKRTGRFRDSILGVVIPAGHTTEVQFFSSDPKAKWILEGTDPHEITSVRAKVLRFILGGEVLFRKGVQHPGTEPSDFVYRSFQELQPGFIHEMNKVGVRAMVRLAGKGA